ncbi:MAG: hypothetical protein KIT87_19640 [Anaerolineae bacterium]|nr:hypothetical protein [Anaerolineae bacterium]
MKDELREEVQASRQEFAQGTTRVTTMDELVDEIMDEGDVTDYLLSTQANRDHLRQALQDLEDPSTYIVINLKSK